jgi:hypothetical protein
MPLDLIQSIHSSWGQFGQFVKYTGMTYFQTIFIYRGNVKYIWRWWVILLTHLFAKDHILFKNNCIQRPRSILYFHWWKLGPSPHWPGDRPICDQLVFFRKPRMTFRPVAYIGYRSAPCIGASFDLGSSALTSSTLKWLHRIQCGFNNAIIL